MSNHNVKGLMDSTVRGKASSQRLTILGVTVLVCLFVVAIAGGFAGGYRKGKKPKLWVPATGVEYLYIASESAVD